MDEQEQVAALVGDAIGAPRVNDPVDGTWSVSFCGETIEGYLSFADAVDAAFEMRRRPVRSVA